MLMVYISIKLSWDRWHIRVVNGIWTSHTLTQLWMCNYKLLSESYQSKMPEKMNVLVCSWKFLFLPRNSKSMCGAFLFLPCDNCYLVLLSCLFKEYVDHSQVSLKCHTFLLLLSDVSLLKWTSCLHLFKSKGALNFYLWPDLKKVQRCCLIDKHITINFDTLIRASDHVFILPQP